MGAPASCWQYKSASKMLAHHNSMDPILALGFKEIFLRIGAAVLVGGVVGWNRKLNDKPAGLRTHALVTLGAAIITISSLTLSNGSVIAPADALSRVIQGIITGIGFLGGGLIIRDAARVKVYGLTTAATVWCAASLGVICGLGHWRFVLLAAGMVLLILIIGGPLEKQSLRLWRKWNHDGNQKDES
jgi:putative Mg2+ transporter-C (MgtC) family protein